MQESTKEVNHLLDQLRVKASTEERSNLDEIKDQIKEIRGSKNSNGEKLKMKDLPRYNGGLTDDYITWKFMVDRYKKSNNVTAE